MMIYAIVKKLGLILPISRRLRDYKNYIPPQRGFNKGIVNELLEKVKHFSDNEFFFVMLMVR